MLRKLFVVFILFVNFTMAFEQDLFHTVNFMADKYLRHYRDYNLYDLSHNPAFFNMAYRENLNSFRLFGDKQLNNYHRPYDAEETENMGLNLLWVRHLNKRQMIASGVAFYDAYHINVNRSLEKNFYNHYFSYSDTTEGDVSYTGPKLWFLYNHDLTDNIVVGLQFNYGVERGLKDIFTECQTILRDFDVTAGISFQSDSKKSRIGLAYRYFNRQSKYDAVKKYVSALTRTWYGFHLYLSEDPRSLSRKNDDREGYEISLSAEQSRLLGSGFGYRLSGSFGEHNNNIKVGAVKDLHQRAYWQRKGWDLKANLFYTSKRLNVQGYYNYRAFDDWAEPKTFDVLTLENEETRNRFGAVMGITVVPNFEILGGLDYTLRSVDYKEYTAGFSYKDDLKSQKAMLGSQLALNQISSVYLFGNIGDYETDFLWQETERFGYFGIKTGYARRFVFGKIDVSLHYQQSEPDNVSRKNEEFGIEIKFLR